MTYTHIVFDIDGTLLDTEETIMRALQKTLQAMVGKRWEMEDLRPTFGRTAADVLKEFGVEDVEAGFKMWKENYLEDTSEVQIFPGVKAALDELRARKVRLGILSSKKKQEYETDFLPYGLGDYFGTVILAEDSSKHKPDPGPMLAYLEHAGAHPGVVLYIGDTLYDMQCADGAGVEHALALWGNPHPDGIAATYRLTQPREIVRLLEGGD